ncbi:MAG TPA: hypothetical protein VNV37_06490 [Solirubrobacteraceae bacterium]|nr:hypothetical protein [Solirubrobacteraceae bacterium]
MAPDEALNSPYLSLSAYCGAFVNEVMCPTNEGDHITYDAEIELFAADIVLSQPSGPTPSDVSGGLAEDPTVNGISDVSFHATDFGSGVYEAIVAVDGQVVEHRIIDEQGGRCRSLGGTSDGLNAFLYTKPCPAEASADLSLNTTAFTNGEHHLVVTVTDAAGNTATVLDREVTVANPPPPGCEANGPAAPRSPAEVFALAAGWKGHANPHLRARYGAPHTLEGAITGPGGAPVSGGLVEVCELPAYSGAPLIPLASPRTDAAGRWSLALPRDLPSSTLKIAYREDPLDLLPVALDTLTLTVPASLQLHVAARRVRAGGAIRLTGSLRGGPLPPGGKQLVLEARSPHGPWIEFHVIRTGAAGRFHYRYRFRLAGPARYQFRVLSEAEADFPFAAGASNVVRVFEG